MMVMGYGIVTWHVRGADVMEVGYDPTTLIRQFRGEGSHLMIDTKRMLCQPTVISVVMIAVRSKVVALVQIVNDVTDTFAIDITK